MASQVIDPRTLAKLQKVLLGSIALGHQPGHRAKNFTVTLRKAKSGRLTPPGPDLLISRNDSSSLLLEMDSLKVPIQKSLLCKVFP